MIRIGDRPLTLDDARAALDGPIAVTLTAPAESKIRRSAETVQRLLTKGEAIYGVNGMVHATPLPHIARVSAG